MPQPPNWRALRRNPDYFVQVRYGRLREFFESAPKLTTVDRLVVYELLDIVDYVTDTADGTLIGFAEYMGVSRESLAVTLDRLRRLGWVDYRFSRGRSGTVQLLIHDQIVTFSERVRTARADLACRKTGIPMTEPPTCDDGKPTSDQPLPENPLCSKEGSEGVEPAARGKATSYEMEQILEQFSDEPF